MEATDMTKVESPSGRGKVQDIDVGALQRDKAKKDGIQKAKKGEYVATRKIRVDGKIYLPGDAYEGLLYRDLMEKKKMVAGLPVYPALMKKDEYEEARKL